MKISAHAALLRLAASAAFFALAVSAAHAQAVPVPVITTAAPIVIGALKPQKGPEPPKFEGTVINATVAQITVRAKGNDMAIQTFSLSQQMSAKMVQIIQKGGYQYGDKVTVFFDPQTKQVLKIKGKPSKAI